MNKNQQKMVHFSNVMQQVMNGTEAEQERLNPQFTALRAAIDAGTSASFDAATYAQTKQQFEAGTNHYAALLETLAAPSAPARFIGAHKLLVAAYRDFVAACQAMTESLHDAPGSLDVSAFNAAEKAQDAATERMMVQLSKITRLA
ncbi:hypothetical protein ACFQ3L_07495 [Lacticaseibacillus jixianensis]|uniref:Chemotaxis protein n=1 Tax=Lacticaseibacillus jixianensis TaxID=2486012 RepID=A0ABW4BAW2_9LACO|nr:hypothetical protein [Lacticaseibacillus jixianensis]